MRSQRERSLPATTQVHPARYLNNGVNPVRYMLSNEVKVLSPEITIIARDQGFHCLEVSTGVCAKGECTKGVPGSKSVAGKRTVYIGTWESRIVPKLSHRQAEEVRRRYGDTVVGLTHNRGVGGVMPVEEEIPLEGVSNLT